MTNDTRGFSRPGKLSRSAGLAFQGTGLRHTGLLSNARWALDGGPFAPAAGWLAGRCRSDTGATNGCDVFFNLSLLPADHAEVEDRNRALQRQIVGQQGQFNFRGWQHQTRTSNGHSCSGLSRFVRCTFVDETGMSRHRRFNYRLTNETVTVRITNFIDQRLEITRQEWGGLVPDARGETPATTLANGRSNSARKLAAYLDADSLPQADWGALRPVDAIENTMVLEYRYRAGRGDEGNTYTDNTVTVRLRIEQNGHPDSRGTTCVVGGRSATARAICTIEGMSYSGRNTELSISLHE